MASSVGRLGRLPAGAPFDDRCHRSWLGKIGAHVLGRLGRAWCGSEPRTASSLPTNRLLMWHALAMIEESFFERRNGGDQAWPGLLARVVTQCDDVARDPPACFHPSLGESKSNPDANQFLLASHLFTGTRFEAKRERHEDVWELHDTQPSNPESRKQPYPPPDRQGSSAPIAVGTGDRWQVWTHTRSVPPAGGLDGHGRLPSGPPNWPGSRPYVDSGGRRDKSLITLGPSRTHKPAI